MIKLTNQSSRAYKKIKIGDKIRIKKYRKVIEKELYIGREGTIVDNYIVSTGYNKNEKVYITDIDERRYYWYRDEIEILK